MKKNLGIILLAVLVVFTGCKFKTKNTHVHTFYEEWESDENSHWHRSDCHLEEINSLDDHSFPEEWKTCFEATNQKEGLEERFCLVCNYRQTKPIEKLPYIGTKSPAESKALYDLVFADGSATPYSTELSFSDEDRAKLIGIVGYVNEEGTDGLIVSLKYARNVKFAKSKPTYNFSTIDKNDTDGSDNFAFIQSVDSKAVSDPATYYPALNYACNYGVQHNITGTFENGWYLPSKTELFNVCTNIMDIEEIRIFLNETRLGFVQTSWDSTPGRDNNTNCYCFLSSNLRVTNLSSGPSYSVEAVRIRYNSAKNTYLPEDSLYEVTEGNYSKTSGGGSNGYSTFSYYSFVMAVHKF